MRGAGYVIVATLILSVSIIMAIKMANAIVVVRYVESVQTLMTVVAHVTAERVTERSDRIRHEEKGKCGPRPEQISERGKAFIRQYEGCNWTRIMIVSDTPSDMACTPGKACQSHAPIQILQPRQMSRMSLTYSWRHTHAS